MFVRMSDTLLNSIHPLIYALNAMISLPTTTTTTKLNLKAHIFCCCLCCCLNKRM